MEAFAWVGRVNKGKQTRKELVVPLRSKESSSFAHLFYSYSDQKGLAAFGMVTHLTYFGFERFFFLRGGGG